MRLTLRRLWRKDTYTIGRLYVDGKYFCDTLEDRDRGLTQSMSLDELKKRKVYGETAIPYGVYRISLAYQSQKFRTRSWARFCNGYLPRLLAVPAYNGVLIHVLNEAKESLGCIGVGRNTVKGKITQSTATFKALYAKMKEAKERGESISIEITK